MSKTLTYDQGTEMPRHKQLAANTDRAVCFSDPHSPWQRGSNKNTNGLVRQCQPKDADLSGYSEEQLDALPMKLTTALARGWKYDRLWRFIGSCS